MNFQWLDIQDKAFAELKYLTKLLILRYYNVDKTISILADVIAAGLEVYLSLVKNNCSNIQKRGYFTYYFKSYYTQVAY